MTLARYDIDPSGILGVVWRRDDGTLHRDLLAPGDDVSSLPEDLQATIRKAWTDEVIAAWRASIVDVPPKRTVPKSVIVSRLIEAGKIGAAYQALNSNPEYWARWVASDRPAINYDDPDALKLLQAIGADPAVILAP